MRKTNNENLQFIEEWARSEETICKEKLQHLKMLCEVIEECDTHDYSSDSADICIQQIFIESEMCEDDETLQDVLSDNIYSRLQEIRDVCSNKIEIKTNLFYRLTEEGNAMIFGDDGIICERFNSDNMPLVYPVDSGLSAYYEHNDGIILTVEDAKKCGIEAE